MAGEEEIREYEEYMTRFDKLAGTPGLNTQQLDSFFLNARHHPLGSQHPEKPQYYSSLSMAYHLYKQLLRQPNTDQALLRTLEAKIIKYSRAGDLSHRVSIWRARGQEIKDNLFESALKHALYDMEHPPEDVPPYRFLPLLTRLVEEYGKAQHNAPDDSSANSLLGDSLSILRAGVYPTGSEKRAKSINELKQFLTAYCKIPGVSLQTKQSIADQLLVRGGIPEKFEILSDLTRKGLLEGVNIEGGFSNRYAQAHASPTPSAPPAESAEAREEPSPRRREDEQEGELDSELENLSTEQKTSTSKRPIIALALGVMGLVVSLPLLIPMLLSILTATTLTFTAPLIPFVILAAVAVVSLVGVIYGAVTLMPKIFQALSSSGGKSPRGGDSKEGNDIEENRPPPVAPDLPGEQNSITLPETNPAKQQGGAASTMSSSSPETPSDENKSPAKNAGNAATLAVVKLPLKPISSSLLMTTQPKAKASSAGSSAKKAARISKSNTTDEPQEIVYETAFPELQTQIDAIKQELSEGTNKSIKGWELTAGKQFQTTDGRETCGKGRIPQALIDYAKDPTSKLQENSTSPGK